MSKHLITDDDLCELQDFLKELDNGKADYLYDKLQVSREATFKPKAPDKMEVLFSLSESIGNGLITMEQLSDYDKNLIQIVHNLSAYFKSILEKDNKV